MGLLKSLTGGDVLSAGSGLLGGIIGGISANRAAKKQYEYQRKLNEQSQEFSEKNATTAYERQRELTQDNPLLQLQGMRNAGLSTSFSDGSSVAGAANVDQGATPSSGSAPSVASLAEGFNQGAQAMASVADLAVKKSQIANTNADTAGKDIDNQYKAQEKIAALKKLMEETKDVQLKNTYQHMLNNVYAETGMASAEAQKAILESMADVKKVEAKYAEQMTEAELKNRIANYDLLLAQKDLSKEQKENLIQERKNMQKQLLVMQSQINLNNANAEDARSHVAVNSTQAGLNVANTGYVYSQKEGQDIQNQVDNATKGDKIAKSKSERIKAWYDALPHSYEQILMSKQVTRDAVKNLQHGRSVTPAQRIALAEVLSYEQASKLFTIIDKRSNDGNGDNGDDDYNIFNNNGGKGKGKGKGIDFKGKGIGFKGKPLRLPFKPIAL